VIARQIAFSRGPSGPNWEYLFKLAHAMRHIQAADEELFLLEEEVKALLSLSDKGNTGGDEEDVGTACPQA